MQKTDFMTACQKEYTNRKLLITGISLQTKESGKQISYDTTHSAFIILFQGVQQFLLMVKLSMQTQMILFTVRKTKELHLK